MTRADLDAYLSAQAYRSLPPGPLWVVLCEDPWLAAESVAHAAALSPAQVLALGDVAGLAPQPGVAAIEMDLGAHGAAALALNRIIAAAEGRWVGWCFAGEFFFYPWCETRTLGDLTLFLAGEQRASLYAYALDLHGADLPEDRPQMHPLWLDREAYYAFEEAGQGLTLQGGLGWRFEEVLAPEPMGRTSLFRADAGVLLGPDLSFAEPAYRSISAPWHHSPTGAVMTLRRLRALLGRGDFGSELVWAGSEPFRWRSEQLLELGMIEPGQWF